MSKNLNNIVEELSKLTILEASELTKLLEEKWGVSAATTVAMPMASQAAAPVDEKTEFDVILIDVGSKKLDVIKELRAITGLSLPESKALTEELPKTIKNQIKKAEAEDIKNKLGALGAKIELK